MSKKQKIPNKLQPWIDARKRFKLSHSQVQMARELGMNPRKFGGKANHDQEPWKMPLPQYIEHLYKRRFGRGQPERVLSIETLVKEQRRKREERRVRKLAQRAEEPGRTESELPQNHPDVTGGQG